MARGFERAAALGARGALGARAREGDDDDAGAGAAAAPPQLSNPRGGAPRVMTYSECAEVTGNTFWKGAPYDELARGYAAAAINEFFRRPTGDGARHRDGGGGGGADDRAPPWRNETRADVVAVSAMEGTGWMGLVALRRWYVGTPHIPCVGVRGASDYTHAPLTVEDGTARWVERDEWLAPEQLDNYTVEGYQFAIQTTSEVVLRLFERRAREP